MITTKQRAYLRGLANSLDAIFQIGKNGIEVNFLTQVEQALEKRELIKISVLESADMTAREASEQICAKLGCEGVQAIGNKLVIYRQAKEKANRHIDLP
ncbi:ribosome assembly RNA-binding protein YhbY [Proteiniclasticum sp. QWL-01]|uniref:ribosome assembly RNA-binding protein YhbY n=1 Tax=Proteiniclasticum sp. QWL-01 TaxID=3036945 RepID=UPI00220DC0D6|nr:ribosome assembly RNA-binding protein YhbY [Proteiniclasticum sp. QWL-01]UUM13169.1 ribosome assembly RNA-binding protein YhbY [Clostridiaceae bacterium HFYG-1003]WFF71595.1 ribosome assembly RNA-binding protein YhbY [Proteiniclasticum sp. QWL-01]